MSGEGGRGVGEDVIQRLFDKIDDLKERLTRVETLLEEREKSKKNYTGLVAWCATTAIAIYGAVHK